MISEYFLNKDILTIELEVGKWRWHTPIMSFIVNGIIKLIAKDEIDKMILPSDQGIFK